MKLFKLFGFLHKTEQTNSKGIGLGLSISQKIANEFEGEIKCKSKPGIGSKFTLRFRVFDETDQNQSEKEQILSIS